MTSKLDKVEKMSQDLKCTGVKITKELIESRIVEKDFKTIIFAGQKMMFCGIKMDNGFVVVGKPATCLDPSNWRDEIGIEVSYENTLNEIWQLEAYRKLSEDV